MTRSYLVLLVLSVPLLGCSDPIRRACRKLRDCQEDRKSQLELEREEQACVDDLTESQNRADQAECSQKFDDYLSCATDHLQCTQDDVVGKECNPAETQLIECMK